MPIQPPSQDLPTFVYSRYICSKCDWQGAIHELGFGKRPSECPQCGASLHTDNTAPLITGALDLLWKLVPKTIVR